MKGRKTFVMAWPSMGATGGAGAGSSARDDRAAFSMVTVKTIRIKAIRINDFIVGFPSILSEILLWNSAS